ncbi:MAG: prepilin peptidase [Candidatus Aenigmarchaeota archaeon]|nr:prepilin peptidase [Candidatus Aenigmarchaeota archaeon]
MFELWIPALIAATAAGLWDLKTTEVPDEIPALMIAAGLFYWAMNAMVFGITGPFVNSVILGTVILALGIFLYKRGQWGAADAWILGSIFYMVPDFWFFSGYIINFFLVAVAYMIIYSVVLGFRRKGTWKFFVADVRKTWKYIAAIPAGFFVVMAVVSAVFSDFTVIISPVFAAVLALISAMAVFWRYGVVVERHVFRKKVSTSHLRPGDVLDKGIWVGLTKEDIKKIRAKKRYVIVKDGIRFVPVFPITLAVTVVFGSLLPLI